MSESRYSRCPGGGWGQPLSVVESVRVFLRTPLIRLIPSLFGHSRYTSLFKFFNILVKFFKFLTYLRQALFGDGVQNSQLCQKIILKACAKVCFTTRELLTNYPWGYSYETACIEQKNWINILYTVVCKDASVGITQRVAMSRKLSIVYS